MAGIALHTFAFINAALMVEVLPNAPVCAARGVSESANEHQYSDWRCRFPSALKNCEPTWDPPHAKPSISTKIAPFEVLSSQNGH